MPGTQTRGEVLGRLRELREELQGVDPLVRERVKLIRIASSMGFSQRRIATVSGLNRSQVRRIVEGSGRFRPENR